MGSFLATRYGDHDQHAGGKAGLPHERIAHPPVIAKRVLTLDLPRFGGHPKRRDNAPGAYHGKTKTPQTVQSRIQGEDGSTVPHGE